MQLKTVSALAVTTLLSTVAAGPPVHADDTSARSTTVVLAKRLLSPLSLAVADDGAVFYSENFKGTLHMKAPGRKARTLFQAGEGTEVGAVSEADGTVRFATTRRNGKTFLKTARRSGHVRTVADLGAYERRANPDAGVRYGFRSLPEGCEVPEGYPFGYTGIVESHPFGTAMRHGTTYVADAAGNAILAVGPGGRVSTVAVLPAVPVRVTPEIAAAVEFPECTVGSVYFLEPVPTDVEVGKGGALFVSSLPGGPEDGSTGAVGGVFRVNPRTGHVMRVVTGLVSATGVGVGRNGDLYVAELFRGRIAKIKKGARTATTVHTASTVATVEMHRGLVYATTGALSGLSGQPGDAPAGRVIRIHR